MSVDLIWQISMALIAASAVYGGIRSDLRHIHERILAHEQAVKRLHERVDNCVACPERRSKDR